MVQCGPNRLEIVEIFEEEWDAAQPHASLHRQSFSPANLDLKGEISADGHRFLVTTSFGCKPFSCCFPRRLPPKLCAATPFFTESTTRFLSL